MTIDSKALEAGKALEIIRDVAYTTALNHREEGRHVLADKIDAALNALPSPKVEGKPVAWRWRDNQHQRWNFITEAPIGMDYGIVDPLYLHPSPSSALADEGVTQQEAVARLVEVAKSMTTKFRENGGSTFGSAKLDELAEAVAAATPPAVTP